MKKDLEISLYKTVHLIKPKAIQKSYGVIQYNIDIPKSRDDKLGNSSEGRILVFITVYTSFHPGKNIYRLDVSYVHGSVL